MVSWVPYPEDQVQIGYMFTRRLNAYSQRFCSFIISLNHFYMMEFFSGVFKKYFTIYKNNLLLLKHL